MNSVSLVIAASLALAVSVPGAALAGQRGQVGQTTGPFVGGATLGTSRSVAMPFPDQNFVARSPVRRFARPVFPFTSVVASAPPLVYAAPPVYYAEPSYYYDPSASYSAPYSYTVPTSYAPPRGVPAPMPGVIEFSTGRYELRGDGISTPHAWVWVPNPPTAPPVAVTPPPTTPPASPATEPASGKPAPPRRSQLYRWTDAQGTEHWTDRLDAVPKQYRPAAAQATSS